MEKFTKQILLWLALLGCTMSTMAANVVTQQTINTVTYDLYDNYTARPWSVNASGPITIQSQITYAGKTYYVTEIDSNAFKNCIHIGSVTISEGITSIGNEAFRGCTGMTSVRIPSTVPIIGMSAFAGCTSLISVTIPEGVTSIAHSAFYACSGLKSITIPEGVTFIGALAFSGCSGLTSLTIPASVTSISSNAFSGCDGLTSVTTNTNANLSYASICFIKDGITYQVLNKNTVSVVANNYNYSGEVVIPEYVSFGNTFITSIDANAFSYCSDLTAVTIPNSITSIEGETFSGCTNLTKVTLNSNAIASESRGLYYSLVTKFGTQVTEYVLGENVTSIGEYAFARCTGLTSVTIPEGVTSIGEHAFFDCSNVQEFVFESETPPTFGSSVFEGSSCPIYVPNASAVTAYKAAANMSSYASRIMIMPTYVVVDGIKYQLQEDGTFAVSRNNYSGEIVIPSSINYNGVPTAVTSIAANAFKNCTGLTAVTIPSSITSIATDVFSGCPNLTKVTLNSNAIASKTYTSDSNLKHIFGDQVTEFVLGEDVSAIGSDAFSGCDGLTSITINTDVDISNAKMYFIKDGFKYQVLNRNSVSVVANSYSGKVVIPETVTAGNIFNVTSIGSSAFYDCRDLLSVIIPESVTSIGSRAFCYCTGLVSVTIPESVTSMGELALANCSNVQEIVFEGETPPTFGSNVLYNTGSEPIYVPNASAVTAYKSATNMSSYNAGRVQVKPATIIVDGVKYSMLSSGKFAVVANNYSGDVVIRESIDYNGAAIAVTLISANAFKDCTDLTSVTIPNSITSIEGETFSGCTNLTKVILNSNAIASKYYTSKSNLKHIFGDQVTKYVLGENVTAIGSSAFYGNTGLVSVTIPESVTSIGSYAFTGCDGLTSVTINTDANLSYASMYFIKDGIKYQVLNKNSVSVVANSYSGEVVIPKTVTAGNIFNITSIGTGAFSDCSNVQEFVFEGETPPAFGLRVFDGTSCPIYVPTASAVTAYKAAENMSNYASRVQVKPIVVDGIKYQLQEDGTFTVVAKSYSGEIVIPSSIDYNGEATAVTSIAANAFKDCTGLTAVTIPSSITSIATNAFSGCTNLTKVTLNSNAVASNTSYYSNLKTIFGAQVTEYVLGEDVTAIGIRAFSGCTGLTSVTIPESVASIGSSAFEGCTGLTSVTIPEGVASIGSSAFSGCTGLTSVTIPEGVTSIGSSAFSGCTNLTKVTLNSNDITSKAYTTRSNLANIFGSQVTEYVLGEDVTSIGEYAFYGCKGLTSMTIPESVTSIGIDAFSGCTNLTKVILNSNAIASNTDFSSRLGKKFGSQVTEYVLGEDVTAIGESAFEGCTGLTSVTIPESVTSIGERAFTSCSNVQKFVFEGETPPTFGTGVFTNTGSGPIYVPTAEAVTAYKAAANMSSYASRVKVNPFYNTISVVANNDEYGTVSGSGTYDVRITPTITISATAAEQYGFAYWNEDGNTEATRTITLTGDATYTAVFKRLITVSNIAVADKVYDGTTTAIVTYESAGVVENDDVTIEATANFADKKIGEGKAVTVNFELGGEDADNYTINAETAELKASITAKTIAISNIAVENKEYDGNTAATVTYTVNGVVENDDVTIELTAEFADENVGEDKAVTYSFAKSGDDADNYELSVENAELKANITAKSIAVSEIVAENKEYDGSATATGSFTYDDSAVLDGESVTIGYEAAFADKNVGEDKTVTFTFSLSGDDKDNYVLASETATATANITAKLITISELAAENKEYDGTTAATVTYTANGIVENDDVTVEPTATFADKNVGDDKVVTYSFAKSGEDADNYTLSVETVDLKANIAAKAITISEIVVEDKEYDGTTAVTATFTTAGAIENEDVAVNYTATFDDKNVGENKIVSLTFELSGEAVVNYVLASETATAMADITAKPIAISNIAADNKIFDGETTATLAFELEGILENDEVEVSYTANFADKNVGEDKAVTFNFAKSGADEANYELAVEATEPKAAITAYTSVEVTITENSGTETYDGTEKTVTGYAVEINSELYKESDFAFNGTADVKGTNAGEYEMNIVASDFENTNANFTDVKFTVVDGKLTIEKSSETPNMPELTAETRLLNITDVALPEGWAWADETIVLEEGENSAVANYVGDDAGNYTVESVTITITRLPCLHDGEYTIVDAQEATCTVDGYTGDHKCSICGAIFEQGSVIPAKGHNAGEPVIENYIAPTCKEAGSVDTVYYCTIDGDLISRETYVLPIVDHVPGKKVAENIIPATTTTEGSVDSVVYCMVGGEELSREHFVLPILDHEHIAGAPEEENRKEPTCLVDGSVDTVVYCIVNGEELSREHYVLLAPGHQPSEKVAKNYVAPTCLVAGSVDSVVTCTVCGEILSEKHFVLPALGHTAGEAVVENYTAPTCTEAGTVDTVYYCTIDNEEISRETYVLPMLEHVAGKKVAENYVAPTKTEEGSVDSVVYCTIGGEELSRESFVLPAIGHDHILGEPVAENYKAPTCTEAGSVDTVVYCLVEGEELSRDSYVLPALGHKPSEKVAKNYVAPMCLVDGSVDSVITCMVCGEILSEEHFVLPATGHIAGEPVVENYTAPTCTTTGTVDTVYYCTIDGEEISRETYVLPMLEHVAGEKVAENYVAPTFSAAGSVDSVVYCTIGGEELSRETFELPMLQKAIEKIEVLSMPKTEYVVGEDIDITGAKISVTFNDGSVEEIDLTNEMLSGFDNTLVAEQDITVTYLTFTTTIHVTVNEKTAVSDIVTDATSIYAYGHTIVVETTLTGDIIVNDVNGRIVAKSQSNGDRTEIYVPKVGVYAVRIGTVSQKVVVR